VLEGRLVDSEGPEQGLAVGAGDFVFRPAGSRHAASAPDGCLMVAIFQVPNRFFEHNGAVVDLVGDAWDAKWGHVTAQQKENA
jgi:quercetin dioxygenase-like cupin family protein